MTPERWGQIEEIFQAASRLEAGERAAYLDQACGGDRALSEEVESLLACVSRPVSIIDNPPGKDALRLLAAGQDESLVGRAINQYKIIARLGAGGMGEVYLARDTVLGRKVALKLLPAAFAGDADQVRRLQHEARAASALNHPNIITIYEVAQADSLTFIATEFVHGETLRQQLRGSRMGVREALEVAVQVGSALAAAHRAGIIHRDVKPENIMLRDDGYVKVLDFGIAELKGPQAPVSEAVAEAAPEVKTRQGVVIGTVGYMSPEQAQGEPLDARTDLFALGVTLYEMVTGRCPFAGEVDADVLYALLNDEPLPLGTFRHSVPPALVSVIGKALKKNRDERYRSAGEMLADLRRLKQQLEQRAVGEESERSTATHRLPVGRAPAPAPSAPPNGITRATAARRYPKWFLLASVAALAVILAVLLFRPQPGWRGGALLVLAVGGVFAFLYLRRKIARPASASYQEGPFRGLLPFQEADRGRFYGREEDTSALFAMVARGEFRFGVLYGDSGSGKTSLLMAGLVPRLRESGVLLVYCRSYKDPLAALLEECQKQSRILPLDAEPPGDYLRRVAQARGAGLTIIFDQFEELFVNFRTSRERQPFVSLVDACQGADGPPLKFLFSIRADCLYLISSEFDGRIPEPLMGDKRFHLRELDEEQAEEILRKSVRDAGLTLEDSLCRRVARDLVVDDKVLPSELQIVGTQLQGRRIFKLSEYQRAGGKEQLVHAFLEDVVKASGDRECAHLLLRSLISDENTRLALTLEEVTRRVQRPRTDIQRLLELLVGARLIRCIQDDETWRYELMHDYLIEKINRITGRVMDATQRANRLLRQYLSNYVVDVRTRIPLGDIWFIRRYADPEASAQAAELLGKSWRRGVIKAAALVLLLTGLITAAAAALSRGEEWDGARLGDGHAAAVRRVVFSPDGRLLVTSGEDGKVIAWDFARRKRLATLTGHTGWVGALAFSPDGKWLASGAGGQTVIVWDAARLEKAAVIVHEPTADFEPAIGSLAFSHDGRLLASSQSQRTFIWEVGTWKRVSVLPMGCGYCDLFFSADGRRLSESAHSGSEGVTWDVATGERAADVIEPDWSGAGAAVSPDAALLVSADNKGDVKFVDLANHKLLSRQRGHRDHARAAAFSPDGRLAATGAEDIVLWDAATRTKLVRLEHAAIVWGLAFSPDGRWLVSAHGDGATLLWDVAERERVANFNEHSAPVRAVAFSRDGRRAASASEDRTVIVWDVGSGRKEMTLIGHETRVNGVAFSPDGGRVASADQGGAVKMWDAASGQLIWSLEKGTETTTYCLSFSPDGRWVATSRGTFESDSGRPALEFNNDSRSRALELTPQAIYSIAFSLDGRRLAFTTIFGLVVVLETGTWDTVDLAERSGATFISIGFSPDGEWLVTGEDEGNVRLWRVAPLRQEAVLGRHTARVKSVVFSPDGQQVASAGDDQAINLWDVGRRRLAARVGTHAAPVLSVAFSPDGRKLLAGGHDKSVRLYTRHRTLWGQRRD